MKLQNLIWIMLVAFTALGCETQPMLFAELERVEGIHEDTPVRMHGYEVGVVRQISMVKPDGRIIAAFLLDDNTPLVPIDSKFYILNQDIFGTKVIDIELGSSEILYDWNDTIREPIVERKTNVANAFLNTLKELKELGAQSGGDSILFELRRLNDNLEKQREAADSD